MNLLPNPTRLDVKSMRLLQVGVAPSPLIGVTYVRRAVRTRRQRAKTDGVHGFVDVAGEAVGFESNLERGFLVMCAVDPQVVEVTREPVVIGYENQFTKRGRYTPDFAVRRDLTIPTCWHLPDVPLAREFELVEVKPAERFRKLAARDYSRILVGAKVANALGWRFSVMTEAAITPTAVRTANAIFSTNGRETGRYRERLRRLTTDEGETDLMSVRDALGLVCAPADVITALHSLIREGSVATDLYRPYDWTQRVHILG